MQKREKKPFNSVDRLQIRLGTLRLDNLHLKDTLVRCNNNKLHRDNNEKTSLHLTHTNGEMSTPEFEIKTGILQGDSPSGLFFILCLLPLSWLVSQTRIDYKINQRSISHLLFMDDLKPFASNDNQV